jgi:release factor glutamine methyltransferase
VVAVDVSAPALALARANAAALQVPEGSVEFIAGDGALAARERAPFDLVLANPPYVALEAKQTLAVEVRDHEPALALFAPAGDPHHWIRRLLDETPALIAAGGALLIEIGHDQREAALELARARGRTARVHLDLSKLPRILEVDF